MSRDRKARNEGGVFIFWGVESGMRNERGIGKLGMREECFFLYVQSGMRIKVRLES